MAPKKKRAPGKKASDLMTAIDRAQKTSTDLHVRILLHELQVHSEEITVQNEQLLKAQTELEQARDLYADLYDFAPIGYLSLNRRGAITEINLAGASILGRERRFLIDLSLAALVDGADRERARDFLAQAAADNGALLPRIDVKLKQPELRVVRLLARPMTSHDRPHALFTAMLDVTEEHRLNRERQAIARREQARSAELAAEVETRLGAEERIKSLLARLVTVQEQERTRLARNIHDELGQQLTTLRFAIGALRQRVSHDDAAPNFERIDELLAELDRDIDFLAWELRPAALDDMGLDEALRAFVARWSELHDVRVEFHASKRRRRLPGEIESHLYRIVQEALNNVGKHARASRVSVTLQRRPHEVTLLIEDDGTGVDATALKRADGRGMGLAGIEERAALIGATVEFESSVNKGAALFVCVPL